MGHRRKKGHASGHVGLTLREEGVDAVGAWEGRPDEEVPSRGTQSGGCESRVYRQHLSYSISLRGKINK